MYIPIFLISGLTQPGIKPESTVSVALLPLMQLLISIFSPVKSCKCIIFMYKCVEYSIIGIIRVVAGNLLHSLIVSGVLSYLLHDV